MKLLLTWLICFMTLPIFAGIENNLRIIPMVKNNEVTALLVYESKLKIVEEKLPVKINIDIPNTIIIEETDKDGTVHSLHVQDLGVVQFESKKNEIVLQTSLEQRERLVAILQCYVAWQQENRKSKL